MRRSCPVSRRMLGRQYVARKKVRRAFGFSLDTRALNTGVYAHQKSPLNRAGFLGIGSIFFCLTGTIRQVSLPEPVIPRRTRRTFILVSAIPCKPLSFPRPRAVPTPRLAGPAALRSSSSQAHARCPRHGWNRSSQQRVALLEHSCCGTGP